MLKKKFKADVIYQRKKVAEDSFDKAIPLLDSTEFKKWCPDKLNQYELLQDLMPLTFLVESQEDYAFSLEKIKTEKAVLKPRRGQKGEDIQIFYKSHPAKLDDKILKTKGYLLQEFCDTNIEVKDVVKGVHDIKLITIGKKIFANLRIPEKGKDYCTFDSPYTEISLENLPKRVFEIHEKVVERIKKKFPQDIYTVDIGLTKEGPIIFELNSHTAFPYLYFEYATDFFNSLIKHLKSLKS